MLNNKYYSFIPQFGQTEDVKTGGRGIWFVVQHKWKAQWQGGSLSVYCDGVGCQCLCPWCGIPVWHHCEIKVIRTLVPSGHLCDMTFDVESDKKPKQTNSQ